MKHGIIVLAVLVALAFGSRVLIRLVLMLLTRTLCRAGLKWVGRQAMLKQPDQIHLVPCPGHAWVNGRAMETLAASLPSLGFADAGVYRIAEMEGTTLRLLAQSEERVAACLYEHPKAGNWIDFFSHGRDGTAVTYTTARPTALEQRPGCTTVNVPDSSATALYEQMLRERPSQEWVEMTPANVVQRFQDAYARLTAWRKNRGISAEEVARHIQQGPVTLHAPQTSAE
jgi:hypothetical protein